MLSSEIISIIAVSISGITSICAAVIPAVLSYRIKKEELKAKLEQEKQQAYEAKFEEFYQEHLQILNDFSTYYVRWQSNKTETNKGLVVKYLNQIAPQFRLWLRKKLYDFANKLENYKIGDNIDEEYYKCRQSILHSYGINVSAETPDFFMSDILKVVLREQFDALQKTTSKGLRLHKF